MKITERPLIFFDFEVFKEDWLVVFIDYDTKRKCIIANDKEKLKSFYSKFNECIFIGYNSVNYDQNILKGILNGYNPHRISVELIEKGKKPYQIFPKEVRNMKFYCFDIGNKFRSLKELEGFMGLNIKETDVDFNIDRKLTEEELKETEIYCIADVQATIEVFEKSREEFDSIVGLIEMFNLPHECISKTKAQLSATILEAKRPDYNRDDEWDIELPDNLIIERYRDVVDWFMSDEIQKEKAKYERDVYEVKHIFALGGIHGATTKKEYDGIIGLWDVASLYPSTIIEYNLMSRNVPNPEKYKEIRELRLNYKKQKNPLQAPLKIVLNSTYGILNDKYSTMYDPRQAHRVCIYNQLFLLDLIEKIENECGENAELIQSNTDGVYFQFKDIETMEKANECVKEWEKRTRYTMELDKAKKIIQRDVNNYILVMENGKVKAKGAVVKKLSDLDYDLPIVNKALKAYLIDGVPFEEYIENENRLIEYQKIYKVTSNYLYAWHNDKPVKHKVNRVFASNREEDTPFYKWKKEKTSPDKYASTPEHAFIDNGDIRNKSVPDCLDKQWYIDRCKSEYKKFTGKVYGDDKNE